MKVDIEKYEEQRGLLMKTTHYAVKVTVTFNEEEKAIIKKRNLHKFVVLKRDTPSTMKPDSTDWNITVGWLDDSKGIHHYMKTASQAKQYEADLIEALKKLKAFLDDNNDFTEDNTSFEL